MSVHVIYYKNGAKMMRPVKTREEYLKLRSLSAPLAHKEGAEPTDEEIARWKRSLPQMNYSCLPDSSLANAPLPTSPKGGENKTESAVGYPLKGCKTPSNSVGMDVDILRNENEDENEYQKRLAAIPEKVLAKKEELGLLMLERSATKGYHLVFRRHPELSQEDNLRWASDLIGVAFDKGAKDITRVFFTTSASEKDLIYLDDEIFDLQTLSAPQGGTDPSLKLVFSPRDNQSRFYGCEDPVMGRSQNDLPVESAEPQEAEKKGNTNLTNDTNLSEPEEETIPNSSLFTLPSSLSYQGIPYSAIVKKWWELYNDGQEPCEGNRNTLTFELAVNLRHICGFDRELLNQVIPDYWTPRPPHPLYPPNSGGRNPLGGGSIPNNSDSAGGMLPLKGDGGSEKLACIDSALAEKRTQMPKRVKEVLTMLKFEMAQASQTQQEGTGDNASSLEEEIHYYERLPKMPMGVRDSIEAVGTTLALPVITAICPAIGSLATGVELDVHGVSRNLNLISYIAGDFASGKGSIDPVVETWVSEVRAYDKMYQMQEDEWRNKKRAAKNKKEQPEEPKLPVRCLTLNNTVANLAERLANTDGKHAFSFTPEADTVAQKWKSGMSDFSVMLRQSYDGTSYEREARSADAVNVHIGRLLWNVTMCGTPDALYRVVNNYTDGFQSRIAVARTPDNTFAPLTDQMPLLTDQLAENIKQVAHLLPLMHGRVVLPKLEAKGRAWVEEIRLATMKDNDMVKARQRFRICVTAQRMTCCLLLCRVCEQLIEKHGLIGAETRLKQDPSLWIELAERAQTPTLLSAYDVIADSLMDNALHFFRDRIEAAFGSRAYVGNAPLDRTKRGKNDSIYELLAPVFTYEQALRQSIANKGCIVTNNMVQQMLKNWRNQGLVLLLPDGSYKKLS